MGEPSKIRGSTAATIASSLRDLIQSGALPAGSTLPTIRSLAGQLNANRNTVAAAYGQLRAAGLVEARRRAGTVVVGAPELAGEGQAAAAPVVNLAHGNPAMEFLPDIAQSMGGYRSTLYGAPPVSEEFAAHGARLLSPDVHGHHRILAAGGAVDALERLLTTHLTRGDLVAVEDPCFVSSIGLLHLHGLHALPISVDSDGLDPDQLDAASRRGARAVVITPRAHNPTGASLSAARARQVQRVLRNHPDVFVIEDDHFSAVSARPYHRAIPTTSDRWALIRSVSKFLGPDLRVAFVAADPTTAERLERRLGAATTWVSHILQHLTVTLLNSPHTQQLLGDASAAYTTRSRTLVDELAARGITAQSNVDGLNVWITLSTPEQLVVDRLAHLGWAVRAGADFAVTTKPTNAIRVTTASITPEHAAAFSRDLSQVVAEHAA